MSTILEKEVYLVIDVGSGSIRTSLYSLTVGIVAQIKDTNIIGPRIQVELLWERLEKQIFQLLQTYPQYHIACVCISSFLGWVAVDTEGNPVTEAWTWMHQENSRVKHVLNRATSELFKKMGRKLNNELSAFKWMALKEDDLEQYNRTHSLLSVKDYLNFKLTGSVMTDLTHAAYTGMLSNESKKWDSDLVALFNLDMDKLPALGTGSQIMGAITNQVAQTIGIPLGTPVVNGGPDGSMAVLGGGGVRPGDTVNVIGTTDVFFTVHENNVSDYNHPFVCNPHLLPDLWLVGGPLGMTGGTILWFLNQWSDGVGVDLYKKFGELATQLDSKPTDLLFIPSLIGERTPTWYSEMKGTIVGLTAEHHKGHCYKSLLEGIGFSINTLIQRLQVAQINIDRIICLGGGARNQVALQIRSDITGIKMDVPLELEASTIGSAILCSLATKHFNDSIGAAKHMTQIKETIIPNKQNYILYQEQFRKYRRLVEIMNGFYTDYL